MSFELDHVFVLAAPGAPEADQLVTFGLTEGSRNTHRGQGTANRRFFFATTMLELLYVRDEAEVRSAITAPTRLAERATFRESGASPFGICIRRSAGGEEALPFAAFDYR